MRPALVSLLLACGLALAACGNDQAPTMAPSLEAADPSIAPYDAARDVAPGRAALSLIPATATTITVTDFDRVRAELGVPDLTSDDLMIDRNDFWERAPQEAVLLTEGLLREQDAVLAAHDVPGFGDLEAFSVSYGDGLGTARLGPDRVDLFERSALATGAPTVGPIGFGVAFENPVVDPSTGRLGWDVRNPRAAAALTLTDGLPWAVCNEAEPD